MFDVCYICACGITHTHTHIYTCMHTQTHMYVCKHAHYFIYTPTILVSSAVNDIVIAFYEPHQLFVATSEHPYKFAYIHNGTIQSTSDDFCQLSP